jgi:hypothetical protein
MVRSRPGAVNTDAGNHYDFSPRGCRQVFLIVQTFVFEEFSAMFSHRAGSPSDNVLLRRRHCRIYDFRLLVLGIVPILAFTGCGGETRVPVFPVSGKVRFKGQVPAGAQIVLHAVNSTDTSGISPSGTVKNDGSFLITAYEPGDGAPAGEYVATIQWFKYLPEAGGAGPNVLPAKYSSAKASPIRVSVGGGPVEIAPIVIK